MTNRSALRPLAVPMAALFTLALALVAVLALTSAPAHAQVPDPGGLLPDPGEEEVLPDPGGLLPAPDEGELLPDPGGLLPGVPLLPAPEESPDPDAPGGGVGDAPQITERPVGSVAAGGGPVDAGMGATPLLVLAGMTMAAAGALLARRGIVAA